MQIRIVNVAQKLPTWADAACEDYLRRLPRELAVSTLTLPLAPRKGGSAEQARQREGAAILDRLRPGDLNIALDEGGAGWSSRDWADNLQRWMFESPRVNLLIGGPDGLAPECLQACGQRVALGRMTMPHALVRVVVIEQVYRAWSLLQGHPYHRE